MEELKIEIDDVIEDNDYGDIDEVDFYLEDLRSKFAKIDPNEYALSYSGGRDSHFLYWFIKEYLGEDRIQIVSVNTRMMFPEILRRIRENADVILLPDKKPDQIKEEVGLPCFTKNQDSLVQAYQKGLRSENLMERVNGDVGKWSLNRKARKLLLSGELHKISSKCCNELKKKPLKKYQKETGRKPIIGVRQAEGILREQYKSCFTKDKKFTPIYDLSDDLLEKIENKYEIEVLNVYNHASRTGCIGCPYGRKKSVEFALSYVSEARRNWLIDYFKDSYDVMGVNYQKYLDKDEEDKTKENKDVSKSENKTDLNTQKD